jgi:hypothetical protein
MDDHVLAFLPVDRGGDAVLVSQLQSCKTHVNTRLPCEQIKARTIDDTVREVLNRYADVYRVAYRIISSKLRPVDAG